MTIIIMTFLIQMVAILGLMCLFGMLTAAINKKFYSNFGEKALVVCYVTGAIGTPVHELAHALFCLIFGHKILEIKLFQIDRESGVLGYVSHSYNPKNFYQKMGNFFIGVAPLLVISSLMFLFAWLLMPEVVNSIVYLANSVFVTDGLYSIISAYTASMDVFFSSITYYRWWIFVLIGMFFALHMNLSGADIQGAMTGLALLIIVLLIIDVILGILFPGVCLLFAQGTLVVGIFLAVFYSLSTVINVVSLTISFIYRVIASKVHKRGE